MTDPRFLYHGTALAAGGRITAPVGEDLPAQAAVVVPITGGQASARADDFEFGDLISFRTALSTVTGSERLEAGKTVFSTVTTSTVEDLNIGRGVVTADRVVARLVSEQTEGQDSLPILPAGSHFVNLRIGGILVALRPHAPLFGAATLDAITAACKGLPAKVDGPVDLDGNPLNLGGALKPRRAAAAGAPGSYEERAVLTALHDLPDQLPVGSSVAAEAWGIKVAGLGTVYLSELLITRFARHLTMIRIELEGPTTGKVVVCDIGGNGSTYP